MIRMEITIIWFRPCLFCLLVLYGNVLTQSDEITWSVRCQVCRWGTSWCIPSSHLIWIHRHRFFAGIYIAEWIVVDKEKNISNFICQVSRWFLGVKMARQLIWVRGLFCRLYCKEDYEVMHEYWRPFANFWQKWRRFKVHEISLKWKWSWTIIMTVPNPGFIHLMTIRWHHHHHPWCWWQSN